MEPKRRRFELSPINQRRWINFKRNRRGYWSLWLFMALFVVSGFVGFVAHFSGSAEFQLELNPDMDTWTLLTKILHAKAPPLLAPGMMIQLGLLGLAYLYSDSRYRRNQGT